MPGLVLQKKSLHRFITGFPWYVHNLHFDSGEKFILKLIGSFWIL